MTDTSFVPNPVAIDATMWASAGDAERTAYRDALVTKHGQHAVDLAIAQLGGSPGGNMPTMAAGPNRDRLSEAQAGDMADALFAAASARIRAAGAKAHLPETAIQAQIDEYQANLERTMESEYGVIHAEDAPELRTQGEIQFDEAFAPPQSPAEYPLQFSPQRLAGADIGEAVALRDSFADAFAAMALPAANAQGLMDGLLDSMAEFEATPEHARLQRWTENRAFVERNLDAEHTWDDVKKYVGLAVGKIPKGELKTELLTNGALDSAAVVLQLYRQGQRIERKAALVAARPKPAK